MPDAPEPTHQERENARRRQEIADHFRNQYLEALALAEQVLGPGWEPTGFHTLVEKDEEDRAHRTNTKPVPAAKVITAAKDGVKRHFRVETMAECETPEAGFGDMLMEPHPTKGFEHRGQWCRIHRYSLCWGWYESSYAPKSAEDLAAARERREDKAEKKWQAQVDKDAANSLFPEITREIAEEARKQKKAKKR
jgi:hypothetical protein